MPSLLEILKGAERVCHYFPQNLTESSQAVFHLTYEYSVSTSHPCITKELCKSLCYLCSYRNRNFILILLGKILYTEQNSVSVFKTTAKQ